MKSAKRQSDSVLLLNIGNTRTQVGLYESGEVKAICAFDTAEWGGAAPGPEALENYKKLSCAVACVVPQAAAAVRRYFSSGEVHFVSAEKIRNIDFGGVDKAKLGADRIANAAGAVRLGLIPAVIIDFGTAITVEIVDENQCFLGGAILPGRKLQREALHRQTAQLPEIMLGRELPERPGQNTQEAIGFGIDNGLVGAVEQLIKKSLLVVATSDRQRKKVNLLCTGGDAEFFAAHIPQLGPPRHDLTLQGLAALAAGKNQH
ncbi:MAG: type III pantothenate kinase [Lentisphaeria bacterium]